MKSPISEASRIQFTDWLLCCMLTPSKRIGAMTNQLYTISLKSRNKTALVSPMRCKFGLGLWQNIRKINRSCLMNRVIPRTARKPNWNHVDRGNLVQHTVSTMLERAVDDFKQN